MSQLCVELGREFELPHPIHPNLSSPPIRPPCPLYRVSFWYRSGVHVPPLDPLPHPYSAEPSSSSQACVAPAAHVAHENRSFQCVSTALPLRRDSAAPTSGCHAEIRPLLYWCPEWGEGFARGRTAGPEPRSDCCRSAPSFPHSCSPHTVLQPESLLHLRLIHCMGSLRRQS